MFLQENSIYLTLLNTEFLEGYWLTTVCWMGDNSLSFTHEATKFISAKHFIANILIFQEFLYFVFVFSLTWLLPLIVMISCYVAISIVIYKRGRNFTNDTNSSRINHFGVGAKSKIKTIKISGILVLGFILCWTPYNFMYVW